MLSLELSLVLVAVLVAAAPLRVNSTVVLLPEELSVVEGENAIFNCTPVLQIAVPILNTIAPGADVDNSETLLNNSRAPFVDVDTDDDGTNDTRMYNWLNAERNDHGRQFFCTLSDDESNYLTLNVNYGVTLSIEGDMFTHVAGESVAVPISLDGRPTPALVWTLNGNVIQSSTRRTLSNTGLTISSVAAEDAGEYVVTASNVVNSTSTSFQLIVRYTPIFTASGETVSLREGQSTTINCAAVGFPPVTSITLSRDGAAIELDSDNSYVISNVMVKDAGLYTCTATNELGSTTLNTTVEVGQVPGQVGNVRVDVAMDKDKVIISWDAAADNRAKIVRYEIIVRYNNMEIKKNVLGTQLILTEAELSISKEGEEISISITVTAVNGVGEGEPVTYDTTIRLGESRSSSLSTLPHVMLSVLLMMCTAVVLY